MWFMVKWKKDETDFTVSVTKHPNHSGSESFTCVIPKPVIEKLGMPKKIIFKARGDKIKVVSGDL